MNKYIKIHEASVKTKDGELIKQRFYKMECLDRSVLFYDVDVKLLAVFNDFQDLRITYND